MKRWRLHLSLGSAALALLAWLLWQLAPVQPDIAVANLSDPAKLATLGPRAANPRLNKIVYWLHEANHHGIEGDPFAAVVVRRHEIVTGRS